MRCDATVLEAKALLKHLRTQLESIRVFNLTLGDGFHVLYNNNGFIGETLYWVTETHPETGKPTKFCRFEGLNKIPCTFTHNPLVEVVGENFRAI